MIEVKLIAFIKFFQKLLRSLIKSLLLLSKKMGNLVHIMKYNNNGIYVANIQISKTDRNTLRLAVDGYRKIYVLFEDKEKIGVEILNQ